jgi:cyclophilin family peptidyl-prolyl cis-trans isomerase
MQLLFHVHFEKQEFDVAAIRHPSDDTFPAAGILSRPSDRCRSRSHLAARLLGILEKEISMLRVEKTRRRKSVGGSVLACSSTVLLLAFSGCGRDTAVEPQALADAREPGSSTTAKSVSTEYPVVRLDTSLGAITVRLNAVKAPLTVRSFLNHVNDGFYTDTLIHYVDADTMILGGGYLADGQAKSPGPSIRNEAHNGLANLRGTIAMTRDVAAGIDSATSQFFINLVDSPTFDHRGETSEDYGYCVFGEVVEGLDVAERISRSPTRAGAGDLAQTPDPPVVVKSIQVIR